MTCEHISKLVADMALSETPDLLTELFAEEDRMVKAGEGVGGCVYSIREGMTSLAGMWDDLQAYVAGCPLDLTTRLKVFDDTAEVADWFMELDCDREYAATQNDGDYDNLFRRTAERLLSLYGLLALAERAQIDEDEAEKDEEVLQRWYGAKYLYQLAIQSGDEQAAAFVAKWWGEAFPHLPLGGAA